MEENRFEIISSKNALAYFLREIYDNFITEYHVLCADEDEFDDMSYNTQLDWQNYIRKEEVKVVTYLNQKK